MINLELNITLKCNMACSNCNRLCHIYRDRTEHMTIEQIQKFIDQAKENGGIYKLKVLGGEPLLHPQFVDIYNLLCKAAQEGIIKGIKIESNKTIPTPNVQAYPFVSWKGRVQGKKKHQPILWSPKDLGIIKGAQPKCPQITKCGYSLDKYGYLPCSCAIMISRLFGKTHLYKHEFPTQLWGLDELCQHCIFSMDQEWRNQHSCKRLSEHTVEEKTPTKSFKEALDKWNPEEFYKTQKEF
jgi:hypothetical protein